MQDNNIAVTDRTGERGSIVARGEDQDGVQYVLVEREDRSRVLVPSAALSSTDETDLRIDEAFDALQPGEPAPEDSSRTTIPVVEEELVIDKLPVEIGRVRVRTSVDERTQAVDVPLERVRVEVERKPVNEVVDAAVEPWYDGNTLVIPVIEERVVLRKELVITEEVRITRLSETEQHHEEVTVRAQRVEVDRTDFQ